MKFPWALSLVLVSLAAIGADRESAQYARAVGLKPDLARGAELFARCASCHGADAGGRTNGEIPRIAGQHFRVLVRQIIDFRSGKRWDMRMEGVATSHDSIPELQDVADVAAYVSGLDHEGARGIGDGQNLERGRALYSSQCQSCHGPVAEGSDARRTPRLAGQHAGYLLRQMYDAVDGRRPLLRESHRKLLAPLDFAQLRGLADYLSRIGQQDRP
jgi:cytochrome c553